MTLPLIFSFSCSEYDFKSTESADEGEVIAEETEDAPGPPDIEVTPDGVSMEQLCASEEQEVVISNIGESPLEVRDIYVSDSGWSVNHGDLPSEVLPGASLSITVEGAVGTGTLTIVSNDPDASETEIALSATADTPPTLTIERPIDGDVLSPGAVTSFRALVVDESDAAEELLVEWTNPTGSLLSGGFADSSGVATFDWMAATMGSGDHSVTATVTDSCGNTVQDTVSFCQNEGYTEDSIDLESWHFEGSARWDADLELVELTQPIGTQAGTAFQTSAAVPSDVISIEFDFYVSGGSGADGISLTALDVDRMTGFVGGTGGGIGYVGLPGWSVEIDTWYNNEHNDPTSEDHVSFHLDGDINTPLAWAELPEMEDEEWHRALIEVEGPYARVSIDGILYIDTEIPGLTPFDAYVGFTAATGGATNWHQIDSLEVEGFVCDE